EFSTIPVSISLMFSPTRGNSLLFGAGMFRSPGESAKPRERFADEMPGSLASFMRTHTGFCCPGFADSPGATIRRPQPEAHVSDQYHGVTGCPVCSVPVAPSFAFLLELDCPTSAAFGFENLNLFVRVIHSTAAC